MKLSWITILNNLKQISHASRFRKKAVQIIAMDYISVRGEPGAVQTPWSKMTQTFSQVKKLSGVYKCTSKTINFKSWMKSQN